MPTGEPRWICFVTGTRAEFGLMVRALGAIRDHPLLRLQVVATGMHLDRSRGDGLAEIRRAGFDVDAKVPWPTAAKASQQATAAATGRAMAGLSAAYAKLRPDVVLVVGDRVEAFAAAAAAHVGGLCVAHVHGGDRAPGVVDDSLRHSITKLAHLHFPATAASAERIRRLGEDAWRIRRVGSPGLDGIVADAAGAEEVAAHVGPVRRHRYALVVLHPAGGDDRTEGTRAASVLSAVTKSAFERIVFVYPNNDPGSEGIVNFWDAVARGNRKVGSDVHTFHRDLPRRVYLGLLRDAAVLVGNSSSGIIEAASFGTPVIDVGPRQHGREHGANVAHADYGVDAIRRAIRRVWRDGRPVRFPRQNVYGGGRAGRRIAEALAAVRIDERLLRKLIAY